jgi:hypothetical protein
VLPAGSLLKKAVNSVLCSACHIHPPYFRQIMQWAGFVGSDDMSRSDTDDSKDSAQQQVGILGIFILKGKVKEESTSTGL